MDRPVVSKAARTEYDRIAAALALQHEVTSGQMMGMPTLYSGGKAFAGLFGDAMVFKLAGAAHEAALALPDARLFDPSGRGRPMKAWVWIPIEDSADWLHLATEAIEGRLSA
jgi:hypothetical protein